MRPPAISIVIPNLNRREQLAVTLEKLTALNELPKQIIVVDNGSSDGAGAMVEQRFPQVELVRLDENIGAAARNVGLEHAEAPITLMLDNDSYPADGTLRKIWQEFADDRYLGVLACRIKLLSEAHESGGLPGVFVGCGAAMRTDLVRRLGGYPEDFGYYVEEYDLSCRVWQSGFRVRWYYDAVVYHAKSQAERNMNRILYYLTRNNLRLWHRYAPQRDRKTMLKETAARYRTIARAEHAIRGYLRGLAAGVVAIGRSYKKRQQLTSDQMDAVFGSGFVKQKLDELVERGVRKACIFGWGKGLEQIIESAQSAGIEPANIISDRAVPTRRCNGIAVLTDPAASISEETILVGSLSPGAALDLEATARKRWPEANVVRLVEFA